MEEVSCRARQAPLMEGIGLCKRFGRVVALEDVDVTIQSGEVVGLLGDNGAGKSTLIKILTGVYRPDGGELSPFSAVEKAESSEYYQNIPRRYWRHLCRT